MSERVLTVGGNSATRLLSEVMGPVRPRVCYYVDANNGSDTLDGKGWTRAKATIQAAVTLANSSANATQDVDIYIATGTYEELVHVSRAGTGLGDAAMLWDAGGFNIGSIGTIRIIAIGNVFWTNAAVTDTQPTLTIGRPNVDLVNFACIRSDTTETVTKTNWTSAEGESPMHIGMPAILFDGEYNGSTYMNGAAANCKVINCRVNAGGARGAIVNDGCNWGHVYDSLMEYGAEYNLAIVGSGKGSPAENLIRNCRFQQGTATDILHGNNIITWVQRCDFPSATVTKYLAPITPGGASQLSTITDCSINQPDLAELIPNAGWKAAGIMTTGAAGVCMIGDADLAA